MHPDPLAQLIACSQRTRALQDATARLLDRSLAASADLATCPYEQLDRRTLAWTVLIRGTVTTHGDAIRLGRLKLSLRPDWSGRYASLQWRTTTRIGHPRRRQTMARAVDEPGGALSRELAAALELGDLRDIVRGKLDAAYPRSGEAMDIALDRLAEDLERGAA